MQTYTDYIKYDDKKNKKKNIMTLGHMTCKNKSSLTCFIEYLMKCLYACIQEYF